MTLEGAESRIWCSKIGWQTVPCSWSIDGEAALTGSSSARGTSRVVVSLWAGSVLAACMHGEFARCKCIYFYRDTYYQKPSSVQHPCVPREMLKCRVFVLNTFNISLGNVKQCLTRICDDKQKCSTSLTESWFWGTFATWTGYRRTFWRRMYSETCLVTLQDFCRPSWDPLGDYWEAALALPYGLDQFRQWLWRRRVFFQSFAAHWKLCPHQLRVLRGPGPEMDLGRVHPWIGWVGSGWVTIFLFSCVGVGSKRQISVFSPVKCQLNVATNIRLFHRINERNLHTNFDFHMVKV